MNSLAWSKVFQTPNGIGLESYQLGTHSVDVFVLELQTASGLGRTLPLGTSCLPSPNASPHRHSHPAALNSFTTCRVGADNQGCSGSER